MANEDGCEDRLTKNEFAELVQHLSAQEILTIEYRIGTTWSKLFSRKNVSTPTFFCNLCVLETSSFKNLLAHIDGKKHKLQMERVKQLYHPDYTHPKNEKKEGVEKSPTNKNKGAPNTPSQSQILGDSDKEKSQNVDKNKTCNKKSIMNFENTSTSNAKQDEIGNDAKSKHKEKIETTTSRNTDEEGNEDLEVVDKKQDRILKGNENTLKMNLKLKESMKPTKVYAEKRSLEVNSTKGDADLKKRKIVVNPAAALSLKAISTKAKEDKTEEGSKKPQYQTNKIIIPTVHKNISHNNKSTPLPTESNDPPKFSVKSYSSKASDNDVHGILGVEYVIKIIKIRNDVSPRYECGLCELVFDGFVMQRHLEGYNHRLKFCEKHFPTAIRHYRQYMINVPETEIFKVMAPVLAKLAIAIEQHHGRNLPYECLERHFNLNRHEILAKAFSCRHASEQYGPTFTHVVGSKEIDELINNRHNYLPPSFSRTTIFDIKPGSTNSESNRHQNFRNTNKESNSLDRHRIFGRETAIPNGTTYKSYMSSGLHNDMYPPSSIYMQADNINAQQVDDDTYNLMVDDFLKGTLKGFSRGSTLRDKRKRSISPARNLNSAKRKSISPLRQNDIWQAYRHMVDQELYDLDELFKQYRKDPETHPSYNAEWQKFWKRRKDELVSAGLDHRKYNYQPEWVRFIKIRVEELYGQEVENLKIKSRERLCLPLTNVNISDAKYHVQASRISASNELLTTVNNTQQTVSLPTISTSLNFSNNTLQVVSVLRLMIALEDSLGSLGPKIIDLLSKALQTEKTNPLHVNAVILNDQNCSLIETAKEKFKGLVMTGLFEGSKKRVLTQVVSDAEALLQYAFQFKHQLASQRSLFEIATNRTQVNSTSPLDAASANASITLKKQSIGSNSLNRKTENILTHVDKKELASKLAASLVAQGKTDFDPQQLQQLIAVYKLIEKKKRDNKYVSSVQDSTAIKKTLSDTLSDLLKVSSSSVNTRSDVSKISNASHSASGLPNQIPGGTQFPSSVPSFFENCDPPNSFTSVLQNSSDNYFNNSAKSTSNSFAASGEGGIQLEQRSNYGLNCTNNLLPNQQQSNMNNKYNSQYQNNSRMLQNWGWNSNMEINHQNNNIGGSDWQNF